METTNVAIQVLDELSKKFGLMVDWSQQNIQPYVQDLMGRVVNYEFWTTFVWIFLYITMALIGFFVVKYLWKAFDDPEIRGTVVGISFFYNLLVLGNLVGAIMKIIRCLILPEVIFVSYLQNFIK